MKLSLLTLIDITETGEHRGPNKLEVGQQANYNTVIQALGLRINPIPLKLTVQEKTITTLGFGTKYKGKNRCWQLDFDLDYGEYSQEMFEEDFDFVPVVTNLTETVSLNTAAFITKNSKSKNIILLSE